MKLHFCDVCNESVPQADFDAEQAVLRKGRVICASCERAMSAGGPVETAQTVLDETRVGAGGDTKIDGAAPGSEPNATGSAAAKAPSGPVFAPPARRSGGTVGVAVGLSLASVALLVALGGSGYLFERQVRMREGIGDDFNRLRVELASQERSLDARLDHGLQGITEELAGAFGAVEEVRIRLEESGQHQRDALGALRDELARLGAKLDTLEGVTSEVKRHERDIAVVSATLADLHSEVLRTTNRMSSLQEKQATQAASQEAAVKDAAKPDWYERLAGLTSQSSGDRWQAVQDLGSTGDPAVAEHLTPMLEDPDIFVRMATARILGDLEAVLGIPALIDALEDPEASVREASVVALQSISGRDFRFDANAKESERAKRVKAWRDWWKKASEELLPGAQPAKS